jgi:hypothetical protein
VPRRIAPTARLSPLPPGRRVARRRAGIATLAAALALLALAIVVVWWLA